MKKLNNMLIALLRSVLCGEELKSEDFKGLDDQTLEDLYKISKKHDMAHLIGAALEKFANKGKEIKDATEIKNAPQVISEYPAKIGEKGKSFIKISKKS